jgi:hypothetical protein
LALFPDIVESHLFRRPPRHSFENVLALSALLSGPLIWDLALPWLRKLPFQENGVPLWEELAPLDFNGI